MSLSVGHRSFARKSMPILGILAAGMVLAAASCSEGTGLAVEREASVEGTGSAAELRARWEQWRSVGPRSYGYELHRGCFCSTEYVTPAWVEVRDGRVVRANALGTRRALRLDLFEPIDSLFVSAIRMAESGGHVAASYHPRLGYPTSLEIGTLANDAGVLHVVPKLVGR
jgi:hypothetical protein